MLLWKPLEGKQQNRGWQGALGGVRRQGCADITRRGGVGKGERGRLRRGESCTEWAPGKVRSRGNWAGRFYERLQAQDLPRQPSG